MQTPFERAASALHQALDKLHAKLGYVGHRRAQQWASRAHDSGYWRGYDKAKLVVDYEWRTKFDRALAEKAGEIEAERNGYKSQYELADRRLKDIRERFGISY